MKYIVDGTNEFETASEAAEYITDNMSDDAFDEMLDDVFGEIDICGYSYQASATLSEVDPIAYRCGKNDYYDSLRSDIEYDIERMRDEDEQDFYGFSVVFKDDEEEEEEEENE